MQRQAKEFTPLLFTTTFAMTGLKGDKVVLVPYRKEHVLTYHEWMKDEQIQQQTASEPLSLEEEYQMQKTWQIDDDKLTFIVLARQDDRLGIIDDDVNRVLKTSSMAGDVNLFFSERQNEFKDSTDLDAELEVMIAEPKHRRKGLGKEALKLLIHYVCNTQTSSLIPVKYKLPLSKDSFVAKIGLSNQPSRALFEQLRFNEVARSEIWKEAELRPIDQEAPLSQAPLAILTWPLDE